MTATRSVIFAVFTALFLAACQGNGIFKAPEKSDCDFFGNCKCDSWYGQCSAHGDRL